MNRMEKWLKKGRYLPAPLRDFHDQKDLFKAMHEAINVEGNDYTKPVNWVAGQCYVIDIFLWFMARRGYTLQRSRAKLDYVDLEADIAARTEERQKRLTEQMKSFLNQKGAA